jgi:MFS transporter, DHA1 family, inner membrane transport protein
MRIPSVTVLLPSGPARRPVLLMALGTFALGTDAFVISGVLPKVGASLGVSLGVAGLLVTVFSGVYAVSAPVLAVATGGMCRKKAMVMALAVFAVANALAAAAPDYGLMVAARVLAALGAGLYTPSAMAAASSLARPEERGRALAAVLGGLTLANAFGVPLGTLIGQAAQWRATFAFVALLGVVAFAGLRHSLPAIPSPGVASLRDRASAAAMRGVPSTVVSLALATCGMFTLYIYLAWFVGRTSGLAGSVVTVVYLIYGVAAVASSLAAGWLIDHVSPVRVAGVSALGLFVACAALALTARLSTGTASDGYAVVSLITGWSLMSWLYYPATQKRLVTATGPRGPVVVSLAASAVYTGQALAGVLGAAVLNSGPAVLAAAAAACELAAFGMLLISARRLRGLPAPAGGMVLQPSVAEAGAVRLSPARRAAGL